MPDALATRRLRSQKAGRPYSWSSARPSRSPYTAGSGGVVCMTPSSCWRFWSAKSKENRGQRASAEARSAAGLTVTIARPDGASQPFCDASTVTSATPKAVDDERVAGRAADGVYGEQPPAALDDGRERRQVVAHAGAPLAVGEEDLAGLRVAGERVGERGGINRVAPRGVEPDDLGAEGCGDAGPKLAEPPHDEEKRLLARAERVGDGGLEGARPARRPGGDVVVGLKPCLQHGSAVGEQLRELVPARVDHLRPDRAPRLLGHPAGTREEDVWRHT